MEKLVGYRAAQDAAKASTKRRHCGCETHLHNGHVASFGEIDWKPTDEEPGEGRDAILAYVDADEHSLTQQESNGCPCKWVAFHDGGARVRVHQAAATLN